MSDDNRKHPRLKVSFHVELTHPRFGRLETKTRDISEGGAFVIVDDENTPNLNSRLKIRVLNLPGGEADEVESEVVRIEGQGIGLKFIEQKDQNEEDAADYTEE